MSEKLLSIRPESQRTAETSKEKSSTAWFSIKRLQRLVIVGPVGIVSDRSVLHKESHKCQAGQLLSAAQGQVQTREIKP